MTQNKKVCIFVDGENLRHSIIELFPSFDKRSYLPKTDWARFFDRIADESAGDGAERIRTYWYVVRNIDFSPYNIDTICKNRDGAILEKIISRDKELSRQLSEAITSGTRSMFLETTANSLQSLQRTMERRSAGWTNVQDGIAGSNMAIEFRRAGSIRYDLLKQTLGDEKAVDVKLATDLIKLKDIYDVAVIVSGDQDYVPAVETIKDFGKRTVNVSFQKEDGHLLPGGAKRLNECTDWSVEMKHSDLKILLGL